MTVDEAMATDSIRTQILNIYAVHNPAKLELVDELLAEWHGNEHTLLANITEKYMPAEDGPETGSGASSARSRRSSGASSARSRRSSGGSGSGLGSPGSARRPTIGRPSSAGAGPRAQEDMDYLRAQLKHAKAQAEAEEAAKVEQQAAQTAGAAVSIQAAWRGKSTRLEQQRAIRTPAATPLDQPASMSLGRDAQGEAPGISRTNGEERTRYVVSIPLAMDGLGIGLQNGADGCPYVAHLDAGGEAEAAGVILNSVILSVSGVAVSGDAGGMDVRDVKGLMAQALRTGQPVKLELSAPAGSRPLDGEVAAAGNELTELPTADSVIEEENHNEVDDLAQEPQDNELDKGNGDAEDESDDDKYEESFEDAVDSEAEAEIEGAQSEQPRTSGVGPPPSEHPHVGSGAESLDVHDRSRQVASRAAETEQQLRTTEAEGAAALAATRLAEIEQLRQANQAAEEQRKEVARLSSTLQEVMQRLTAAESTSGQEEGRVESELAALRQSVSLLVSDKHDTEITTKAAPVSHNPPLWGPQSTDFDEHGVHTRSAKGKATTNRARSSERARSAERERLRARSAERDRLREQLHPKHAPVKQKWTYKKKHGYNPEVWNRLYPGAKKPSPVVHTYDSMAWGKPEDRDESQKENSTKWPSNGCSPSSHNPLSVYGSHDQQARPSGLACEASAGQFNSHHSSSSMSSNSKNGAQRRRSIDRSTNNRMRRAGSAERQRRSYRRPDSTGWNDRRPSDLAAQSLAHGVSRTYPEPSSVPGPLWLSGLMDADCMTGDEHSLPGPLSPQSTVEFQPSLNAAVSGAARHSDDYAAFVQQHPVAGARAPRRPLASLASPKVGTPEQHRERERSYSDYGVYESPMSRRTAEDIQESGGRAEEKTDQGREEAPGTVEQQQRQLVGALRDEHFYKCEQFGDGHPETVASLTKYVEHTTGMATMFLETGRGNEAWELLSDVHTAAKHQPMLLPGVQNSMACCLRRAGRLRGAESLLQKAAAAVKGKGHSASARGNTYLNLCAVLSSQGKHKAALDAAKQALAYLRKGLTAFSRTEPGHSSTTDDDQAGANETPESRRERADLAAMLAMTLHNAAVQHEHLEQWKHALAAYQCAANCATECLGTEHSITISLTTACKEARRTIARKTGIVRHGGHGNNNRANRAASPKPINPRTKVEAKQSLTRGSSASPPTI